MERTERFYSESTGSSLPLLLTKLFVPSPPVNLVTRKRLLDELNGVLQNKLTIVTAPAGYGKSTVVSEWASTVDTPVSWISLDHSDNDSNRFWMYVIAAIQSIHPEIGSQVLALLKSPQNPPITNILGVLVNELVSLQTDIVVVLDDFHVIKSEDIHQAFIRFIDYIPPHVHICIVSRNTLSIPLSKLRISGMLKEITMNELRFTYNEIIDYWKQQVGISLTAIEANALEEQTEGWIAGLQLAVISNHQQSHQTAHLVAIPLSGYERNVEEYLLEEVFDSLPGHIQNFLLQTSILNRLNASLCTAVTDQNASDLLPTVEQLQLFLIPLDHQRYWYRYHHLFAEFLQNRLAKKGKILYDLHLRASHWFEQNQFVEEAIEHAFFAKDYDKAATLIQGNAFHYLKQREVITLHQWLERLPDYLRNKTEMLILYTWTQMLQGKFDGTLRGLDLIEQQIERNMPSLSRRELFMLQQEVVVIKNYYYLLQGDFDSAYTLLLQMDSVTDLRDVDLSESLLGSGIEQNDGSSLLLRGFYGFNGNLNYTKRYFRLYNDFEEKNNITDYHFSAYPRAIQSELYYEQNKLEKAKQYAEMAIHVANKTGNTGAYVPAVIVLAKIHLMENRPTEVQRVIQEALHGLQNYGDNKSCWESLFQAFQTRCNIIGGKREEVECWLSDRKISSNRTITIYQEYENVTILHAYIFLQRFDLALPFSERMKQEAERSNRIGSRLETYMLQAIILQKVGNVDSAIQILHQALVLGETYGYCRTFIDEGIHLSEIVLLYLEIRRKRYLADGLSDVTLRYVEKLLSAMAENQRSTGYDNNGYAVSTLTKREQEILRLLVQGLSNKEIAEQLVITTGTVKLHVSRIYDKLHCSNRIQAVQKVKELQLFL